MSGLMYEVKRKLHLSAIIMLVMIRVSKIYSDNRITRSIFCVAAVDRFWQGEQEKTAEAH